MSQPTNLKIEAWYSTKLSKTKTAFVSIHRDKDATQLNVSTTGPRTGEVLLKPDEIDDLAKFLHESVNSFSQVVSINQALVRPVEKEAEKKD